ncbi:hypothetical protein [Sphingomonas bisphenolicum]|nr:hypothetical protein [Sphingomonas bisphenolicum]
MREPDIRTDGWCLENGEAYHRAAPETFCIPERLSREALQPGDLVKLIFRISIDDPDEPEAVERMWVLVRERIKGGGYLGILDNDPYAVAENDEFWSGIELPFWPHHIIDIQQRDENTLSLACEEPKRRWL